MLACRRQDEEGIASNEEIFKRFNIIGIARHEPKSPVPQKFADGYQRASGCIHNLKEVIEFDVK
jgi:hypothetical protein